MREEMKQMYDRMELKKDLSKQENKHYTGVNIIYLSVHVPYKTDSLLVPNTKL